MHPLLLTSYFPHDIWHLNSCIQRMEGQPQWQNIRLLYSHLTFFPTTDSDNFKHEKSSCSCKACSVPSNSTLGFEKICISLLLSVLQKAWRQLARTTPKSESSIGKSRGPERGCLYWKKLLVGETWLDPNPHWSLCPSENKQTNKLLFFHGIMKFSLSCSWGSIASSF